jgi:hypothetical protein
MTNSKENQARAEAQFYKKAPEATRAMSQYETDARAITEKTAKLRALRLAKEAADKELAEKINPTRKRLSPTAARASANKT